MDLPDSRQIVLCPANCTLWSLSVFGSGVYASISSICGAAIHRYNHRSDWLAILEETPKAKKVLSVLQRNHRSIGWTCGGSRAAREDKLPKLIRSRHPVSIPVAMELIFHCSKWVETITICFTANASVCFDLWFVDLFTNARFTFCFSQEQLACLWKCPAKPAALPLLHLEQVRSIQMWNWKKLTCVVYIQYPYFSLAAKKPVKKTVKKPPPATANRGLHELIFQSNLVLI